MMKEMSVTQIISEIMPFYEPSKQLWIDQVNDELRSLGKSVISYETLLALTSTLGDTIHRYFMAEAMGFPNTPLPDKFRTLEPIIASFIAEHEIEGIKCEFEIIKPGEYNGHPDMIVWMRWWSKSENVFRRVKALVDIKTYQLYRWYLGLPEVDSGSLAGNRSKVQLQTSMYRDALIYSVPEHYDVTHSFCFHVKHDAVESVQLKYDTGPYIKWLAKQQRIS